MIKFEKVSKYKDSDFAMPERKTQYSAGYDMVVAEDTVIPPFDRQKTTLRQLSPGLPRLPTLVDMARFTSNNKVRPTLVPTGVKCYLEPGYYLELVLRSSSPLKYWLVMGNSVGVIDGDYADNPDNEGEIFFQVINLGPMPLLLKKGDIIGQGIIKKYEVTDNDVATGTREGGFGSTTLK